MERPHIISTLTKCFSAILLLTAYSILGFSQASITIRFSGQLDGSAYQRLDSVKVTDISKGWTETVYYPDTIAILRKTNSLGTITSDNNALYQNAPNPFICSHTHGSIPVFLCIGTKRFLIRLTDGSCDRMIGVLFGERR